MIKNDRWVTRSWCFKVCLMNKKHSSNGSPLKVDQRLWQKLQSWLLYWGCGSRCFYLPYSHLLCLVSQLGRWPFIPYTTKPFVLQGLYTMEFFHLKENNLKSLLKSSSLNPSLAKLGSPDISASSQNWKAKDLGWLDSSRWKSVLKSVQISSISTEVIGIAAMSNLK